MILACAVETAIQLLMEFGGGSLSRETIRDGAIFINEEWMFEYATAMKHAREFKKTKKIFFSEVEDCGELIGAGLTLEK